MNNPLPSAISLVMMASQLSIAAAATASAPDAVQLEEQTNAAAEEVVEFWRNAGPSMWFAKDPQFDRSFRERFLQLYEKAAQGELQEWSKDPRSTLALLILLDQFPRNSFRGTPRMYATDELARKEAETAIALGHDQAVPKELRLFFYLPFAHSENLADQERSVELARGLSQNDVAHAEHHRDIVKRFGRFPHRNAILGRVSTPQEEAYLNNGGYRG
jgi:uncharacterized protein (DUF924 family)